jgi:glucosamine--fructose-6-phosphate aminotransferase (isomerizing)
MHHDVKGLDLFEEDILREGALLTQVVANVRAGAEAIASTLPTPTHVYLVGCGDSYDAGIAASYVWSKLLGVPVEAVPAMTFATAMVDVAPAGSLVVGLSVSGKVSRVVEAIRAASNRGFTTVTVTMNGESPFALEPSTATWKLDFTKLGAIPGTTSHLVGALGLYELACALAGPSVQRDQLRAELDGFGALVAQAVTDCVPVANKHAEAMARDLPVLLIGYGVGMSAARFSVRKLLELTQLIAFWQETEEYAHDEYSLVDKRFRVLQLAPPDRGSTRNAEIAHYLRRLDVHLSIVTDGDEADRYEGVADIVYRLPACPPALAPFLYVIPGQLLALATARTLGGSLYGMAEQVHREDGDPQIYDSEIVA